MGFCSESEEYFCFEDFVTGRNLEELVAEGEGELYNGTPAEVSRLLCSRSTGDFLRNIPRLFLGWAAVVGSELYGTNKAVRGKGTSVHMLWEISRRGRAEVGRQGSLQ